MNRLKSVRLILLAVLLPVLAVCQTESDCTSPESDDMDYMLGHWYGVQYIYEDGDSVFVGTTELEVKKILDGCANKEIMDVHTNKGMHVFNGIGLRSYVKDEGWRFTEVDDRGGHYVFTSKYKNGTWFFYDDRERDGRKYILRLSYPKVNDHHFKQIFDRSFDEGKSWTQGSHIDFYRDKPHPE